MLIILILLMAAFLLSIYFLPTFGPGPAKIIAIILLVVIISWSMSQ